MEAVALEAQHSEECIAGRKHLTVIKGQTDR